MLLIRAIKKGNLEDVMRLVESGVDPTFGINAPIAYACEINKIKIVKFLLTLPEIDITANHNLAFRNAVRKNHLNMAKFLATLPGVNPSDADNDAIVHAIGFGHIDMVKFLLTLPGVYVSAWDNRGLRWAATGGFIDMIKFLLNFPEIDAFAWNTALFNAAWNSHIDLIEFLLDLPCIDVTHDSNKIIYLSKNKEITAMLLYYEPKIKATLPVHVYHDFHKSLVDALRPTIYKIAITLTELPTPILIEIVEQTLYFAIYVPYHIKWNMVVKIKHSSLAAPAGASSA